MRQASIWRPPRPPSGLHFFVIASGFPAERRAGFLEQVASLSISYLLGNSCRANVYNLKRWFPTGNNSGVFRLFPGSAVDRETADVLAVSGIGSAAKLAVDINCDLGEGEAPARVRALMRWVSSANVACGGHAGNVHSMDYCVRMARGFGVRLGAHPGYADRAHFGRKHHDLRPADLELLLVQQVGALEKVAADGNMKLHHIKLHGALYHAVEGDSGLATCYAETVARFWPKAIIYAAPEGRVAQMARFAGVKVWAEAFADRAYMSDGTLVPRNVAGAVLGNTKEIVSRMRGLLTEGALETISGGRLHLQPKTLCVHSDTAEAIRIARALATELT